MDFYERFEQSRVETFTGKDFFWTSVVVVSYTFLLFFVSLFFTGSRLLVRIQLGPRKESANLSLLD